MMKRTILIFGLLVFCLGLSAQTWSRYGIRVGRNPALVVVDSVKRVGNTILFYDGATSLGTTMTYPGVGIAVSTGAAWGASITDASANWNTAYTDRLKWDGGATGLVAATGRASLGGTTVGAAFFMLTNPGAITFPRINADNSVTALSAANFKTALSLVAGDVSLGNLTNKLQVELEDSAAYANGYMSRYDGVTGLALKLNKADSATMAGGYTSYADGVAGLALKLNKADSVNYTDGYMSRYDGVTGLAGKVNLADSLTIGAGHYVTPKQLADSLANSVALETIAPLLADSSAFWMTFGLGSGQLSDTASFNNNALIGSTTIPPSDTIHVVKLSCKKMEGSGTESVTVNICWDNDSIMSGNPVKLNTAGYTFTTNRIKNEDTSFNANDIPPGRVLYGYISGITAGNKPSYLECTLSGYKYNRSY